MTHCWWRNTLWSTSVYVCTWMQRSCSLHSNHHLSLSANSSALLISTIIHALMQTHVQTAGIDNTVARYKESRPVLPHATPFERRVERALLEEEEVVRDIVCSDRLTDKRIKARRA